VLLNFVLTLDGQATVGSGGAAGIGSSTDHRLMRRLRVPADALLYGAGTVRRDNFTPSVPPDLEPERLARGLAAQPLAAVISTSGQIPHDNAFFNRGRPFVFTTEGQAIHAAQALGDRARVLGFGAGNVDLAAVLRHLREAHGVRVLLCEGGPHLTRDLIAAGLLDELFLTLAPKLGSDRHALRLLEGPPFPVDALPEADLVHLLAAGSELFLRYRLRSPGSIPA
jgi:riboflavin-specific deaminase-like protein